MHIVTWVVACQDALCMPNKKLWAGVTALDLFVLVKDKTNINIGTW